MTDRNQPSRRAVLSGGAAAGAAALVGGPAGAQTWRPAAPAVRRGLPDVVVIGAGAFGGWTALRLVEEGAKVVLVDLYGAGNIRASSGGESRNIRASYGERELYTRMADMAWTEWQEREREFGSRILHPNGSLRVLRPEALAAQQEIFTRLGLPYELLDAAEVARRWPQLRFEEDETIFFEHRSGIVKARDASIAVETAFVRRGGESVLGRARPGSSVNGVMTDIELGEDRVSAGAFVFACGPWLPRLLPEVLDGFIRTPRSELFFFGPEPGDHRFHAENTPNISDLEAFTSADLGSGYKVGTGSRPDTTVDMDDEDRLPTPSLRAEAESFISRRLPGLAGRPLIASHVCQTEISSNRHFIIDAHPGYANVWIAGAGSGHAFKMGPVLGRVVASRVLGLPDVLDDGGAFALSAHAPFS